MNIKEGEFVSIDYIGKVNGKIFDLTDEKLAKKEGIYEESKKYGPVTIVVGAGHLVEGLDKSIVGKDINTGFEVEIEPEEGFGKKNPKLLKIIPERTFKEQQVNPVPGMAVSIDGLMGHIISCSGGRAVIDFNHPLAGKTLNYKVKILRMVDDEKEQLRGLMDIYTGLTDEDYEVKIEDGNAKISVKKGKKISEKAKGLIKEDSKKYMNTKSLEFIEKEKSSKN